MMCGSNTRLDRLIALLFGRRRYESELGDLTNREFRDVGIDPLLARLGIGLFRASP